MSESQDPPADVHCAHVVVGSQHSVEVHIPAGHAKAVGFFIIEPLVQGYAEHEDMSQHEVLQLLSVPDVPSHFKPEALLSVCPVGQVYEEHAYLSSAQHAASVEPTKFRLIYLLASVQIPPL